jgi:hypothetical protein
MSFIASVSYPVSRERHQKNFVTPGMATTASGGMPSQVYAALLLRVFFCFLHEESTEQFDGVNDRAIQMATFDFPGFSKRPEKSLGNS